MKMLESVQKALKHLHGSFINHNNEIILIPKFNVYTLLDDVETDDDFKVKLCEWFSRDCCCALRYSQNKRLEKYYQENTDAFNFICGTNFTVEQMEQIYTKLGNGIKHELAKRFVKSGFDLSVIAAHPTEKCGVVQCHNCSVPHNRWTGCPKLNGLVTPPDFYCSYGERRKEDDAVYKRR